MRIALYGGSYNPAHIGHITAARAVVRELRPDRLLMMPASVPPHKELESGSAEDADRLRILELLIPDESVVEVSDMELRRGGVSYTAETVEELRSRYPESEIFLLMGTDMLGIFEKWYNFQYIIENTTLAVFGRNEGDDEKVTGAAEMLKKRYGARIVVIPNEPVEISSTQLRGMLASRSGVQYLSDEAYAYIIRKRLYGAKPDLDWLMERALPFLDERRAPHVKGCAVEAVKLAAHWGADEGDAAEAAILHDITKKCSSDEQLILCEKYDIIIDSVEKNSSKLLHSKTGAAIAREEFGVPENISESIVWHTTGKADMTLLEKILYVADYIEPTRDFEGVDKLRSLAYTDLDAAMELGLKMSVEDLVARGEKLHVRTVEAFSWFEQRKGWISK